MELTKEHFDEHLAKALEPLATKKDVRDAVDELAGFVAETVANPMEQRFQQMDVRFQEVGIRLDKVDSWLHKVDSRLDKADVRLGNIESDHTWKSRVHKLENDMGTIKDALYLS